MRMKQDILIALCVGALMALPGCAPGKTEEQPLSEPAATPPILAVDLLLRHHGPELTFNWSIAPEAALEPGLFFSLKGEGEEALRAALTDARADHVEAARSNYPFRPHSHEQHWSLEAETPQLLALMGETYTYTGGAHGMTGYASAIWDRHAGTRIESWDIFTDRNAAVAALTPQWCKELDAERAVKREGVETSGFDDCPPMAEQAMVPVGTTHIYAVKVIAGPYVAGPYSEGSYEVVLDLDAVHDMVKEQYRASFR